MGSRNRKETPAGKRVKADKGRSFCDVRDGDAPVCASGRQADGPSVWGPRVQALQLFRKISSYSQMKRSLQKYVLGLCTGL